MHQMSRLSRAAKIVTMIVLVPLAILIATIFLPEAVYQLWPGPPDRYFEIETVISVDGRRERVMGPLRCVYKKGNYWGGFEGVNTRGYMADPARAVGSTLQDGSAIVVVPNGLDWDRKRLCSSVGTQGDFLSDRQRAKLALQKYPVFLYWLDNAESPTVIEKIVDSNYYESKEARIRVLSYQVRPSTENVCEFRSCTDLRHRISWIDQPDGPEKTFIGFYAEAVPESAWQHDEEFSVFAAKFRSDAIRQSRINEYLAFDNLFEVDLNRAFVRYHPSEKRGDGLYVEATETDLAGVIRFYNARQLNLKNQQVYVDGHSVGKSWPRGYVPRLNAFVSFNTEFLQPSSFLQSK